MELRRMEVNKIHAYGSNTIFVPTDGPGAQMGQAMAVGMAAGMGRDVAQREWLYITYPFDYYYYPPSGLYCSPLY